ncbi:MAG: hypothetical protein OXN84_03585 [Albidovulum sp.]|nr:hypothetical protein [Albidovulum sp.]
MRKHSWRFVDDEQAFIRIFVIDIAAWKIGRKIPGKTPSEMLGDRRRDSHPVRASRSPSESPVRECVNGEAPIFVAGFPGGTLNIANTDLSISFGDPDLNEDLLDCARHGASGESGILADVRNGASRNADTAINFPGCIGATDIGRFEERRLPTGCRRMKNSVRRTCLA